jgi:hypothetical protein
MAIPKFPFPAPISIQLPTKWYTLAQSAYFKLQQQLDEHTTFGITRYPAGFSHDHKLDLAQVSITMVVQTVANDN